MAEISVTIESGGLGRQSTDTDTWGGIFIEVDSMPSGWTENEVKEIYKPGDLEDYGISADATNYYYLLVFWHVSEVFRLQSDATLYVQLATTASATTYADALAAFNTAEDNLRLFAFVRPTVELATSEAESLNSALDNLLDTQFQPARAILTCLTDQTDGTIPDFSDLDYYRVMVDVANDLTSGSTATTVFSNLGMCGAGGTLLGQLLLLKVHQKPSWRSYEVNGDWNSETRWSTLGDINGDSVESKTQTEIEAYGTQGVVLITRTVRLADAYFSSARTAGETSDDFAVVNYGRVIDKAMVLAYDALVGQLEGPIYVDPDSGEINSSTIAQLQKKVWNNINTNMILGRSGNDIELSVDTSTGSLPDDAVYIDPDQDILSTDQLEVQIRLIPVGSSDTIVINIGLQNPSA